MKCSWREGNKIQLLENGEQYYPAVFKAIGEAQERIILETFIWFEDDVGKQLHAALLAAAHRGPPSFPARWLLAWCMSPLRWLLINIITCCLPMTQRRKPATFWKLSAR